MRAFWQLLYSYIVIPILWVIVHLAGLANAKVQRAIAGRRNLFTTLEKQIANVQSGQRVWFHASSMGEFEQARPVIAELKRRHPSIRVIVTFFSPSGYEHARKYPLAEVISYIPFDSLSNAKQFVEIIRPDVAVMVRYDIWPNHIWELDVHGIPTLLANATMKSSTPRRLPLLRNFHHHVYDAMHAILTVAESDVSVFRVFETTRPAIVAVGDTRYDQVSIRSAEARKRHLVPARILENRRVVVAGSTWPEDEEVLVPAILQLIPAVENMLVILTPHEPTLNHLERLEERFIGHAPTIRFSSLNEYAGERIIIVDSVGILLALYANAHVAYVGGSFKQGIHNVLEAAAYDIPVLFGPKHRNSPEPLSLVEEGGAFIVNDTMELHRTLLNLLEDETARQTAGTKAGHFVRANVGATNRVIARLEELLGQRNRETVL